jgi:hypothetical protein
VRFLELIFILVTVSVVAINLARRLFVSRRENGKRGAGKLSAWSPQAEDGPVEARQGRVLFEEAPAEGKTTAAMRDESHAAKVEERVSQGAFPVQDAGRETGESPFASAASREEDVRPRRHAPGGRGWDNIRRLPPLKKAVVLAELLGKPRGFPDDGGELR